MTRTRAELLLVVVALIWGLTFPLIRNAMTDISALQFVFLRFLLATLLFAAFFLFVKKGLNVKGSMGAGIRLGLVLGVSYLSQTIGLETVSSARAAFVTGSNIVMVPFLAAMFGLGRLRGLDLFVAACAMLGLYFLTDPRVEGLSRGDAWVFLCAFTYALYIVLLQWELKRKNVETLPLSFLQIAGVLLFSAMLLPFDLSAWRPLSTNALVAITFCATFATIGTCILQTKVQAFTSAGRAAVIFALEPVFAAGFGFLLLAERITLRAACGCAIIFAAVLLGSYFESSPT